MNIGWCIIIENICERGIILGNFIGAIGALLMIALIAVLFFKFILELGAFKGKGVRKSIVLYASAAAVIGLVQLLSGALIANFTYQGTVNETISALNAAEIWKFKPVTTALTDMGTYSFSMFKTSGILPIYPVLVSAFSKVLFDMYAECALYISYISAVVFYSCLGLLLKSKCGDKDVWTYFVLLLCMPGSFVLFLPGSFALGIALLAVTVLVLESNHNAAAVVLTIICCLTNICGVIAIALLIYKLLVKEKYKTNDSIKLWIAGLVQLVVAAIYVYVFKEWGSDVECFFIIGVIAVLKSAMFKLCKHSEVIRWFIVIEVILSGVYMTAKINSIF